jgi:hypothetical protein
MTIERDIWWRSEPVYLVAHVTEDECEARIYSVESGDRLHLNSTDQVELEERAIMIYQDKKNEG